jgi:hypothetical protein
MATVSTFRFWLVPLLLLASGRTSRCVIATDARTGELLIVGTIDFLEADGGCWRVTAADGHTYVLEPDRAPAVVLRDGARVRLVAEVSDDQSNVCAAGTAVEVTRGEVLERGS